MTCHVIFAKLHLLFAKFDVNREPAGLFYPVDRRGHWYCRHTTTWIYTMRLAATAEATDRQYNTVKNTALLNGLVEANAW